MNNASLVRSLAAGAIAGGAAVLCWFNRLPKHEQEEVERKARQAGQRLLDLARCRLGGDEPPMTLAR
jgi:hypothetical protein